MPAPEPVPDSSPTLIRRLHSDRPLPPVVHDSERRVLGGILHLGVVRGRSLGRTRPRGCSVDFALRDFAIDAALRPTEAKHPFRCSRTIHRASRPEFPLTQSTWVVDWRQDLNTLITSSLICASRMADASTAGSCGLLPTRLAADHPRRLLRRRPLRTLRAGWSATPATYE
jgi:hypothetical protein